mgnify:FL=1
MLQEMNSEEITNVHNNISDLSQNNNIPKKSDLKHNFDLPRIEAWVENIKCLLLIDSGSTNSVCSLDFYNKIVRAGIKVQSLPTCSIFCNVAIGRKKQRINSQAMFKVRIGNVEIEMLFLVIKGLIGDAFIGCDSLAEWEAKIDFAQMSIFVNTGVLVFNAKFVKAVNEAEKVSHPRLPEEIDLHDELFFVDSLKVKGVS